MTASSSSTPPKRVRRYGVPLPPFVIEALESLVAGRRQVFLLDGRLEAEERGRRLAAIPTPTIQTGGVPDGHAYRFRDTFAVELLLAGVAPLKRVSILLGHQSVKVTEKHYNPWVRARQEQLESDVRRTWDNDILAAVPATKGTPEVHGARLLN